MEPATRFGLVHDAYEASFSPGGTGRAASQGIEPCSDRLTGCCSPLSFDAMCAVVQTRASYLDGARLHRWCTACVVQLVKEPGEEVAVDGVEGVGPSRRGSEPLR